MAGNSFPESGRGVLVIAAISCKGRLFPHAVGRGYAIRAGNDGREAGVITNNPKLVIRNSMVVVKLANMCSLAVDKEGFLMVAIRESCKIAYLRA